MTDWNEFTEKVKADWNVFAKKVKVSFQPDGEFYAVLMYTDRFEVLTGQEFLKGCTAGEGQETDGTAAEPFIDPEWILDVRVFNEDKELRLCRDYIGNEFRGIIELSDNSFRLQKDSEPYEQVDSYDDYQYLDIDLKRSSSCTGKVRATGGGEYRFPSELLNKLRIHSGQPRIKIRNYVAYDNNGQAYIKAWRLVGFAEG